MNVQTAMSSSALVPTAQGMVSTSHNGPVEMPKLTDAEKEAISKAMASLADKLAKVVDDEVNALVVAIDASKKEVGAGPFRIMKWAMDHIDPETLAQFPTPGTDATTSKVPDSYEEAYFRDGKKRFRRTSFYLKFFLGSFPEGKRIAAALAHVAIAKDTNANQAAVPAEIRKLDPVGLDALKSDLTAQQNNGVKSIRDAFALMKQMDAVAELPKVGVDLLYDGEGNVRKITKPIKVWNMDNPETEWQLYSISGFMQFDPAAAAEMEGGGTFDALKLTAKREQDEGGGEGSADKPVPINTNATFANRINDVAEYVANKLMSDKKRELYSLFLKDHIAAAGSDDMIYNLSELKLFVDGVLGIPAVQTRLEIVNAARAAA